MSVNRRKKVKNNKPQKGKKNVKFEGKKPFFSFSFKG